MLVKRQRTRERRISKVPKSIYIKQHLVLDLLEYPKHHSVGGKNAEKVDCSVSESIKAIVRRLKERRKN